MSMAAESRPLPWQREVWERLVAIGEAGRLGHAILLTGAAGTGRQRFAEALARRLLCEAPLAAGNCGRCKNCELSRSGAHPDFMLLEPEEAGRAIGIDSVREVLRFIAQTSARGLCRIVLVNPLDALTLSACNAFLKGLEEPGANTHFLLLHTQGRQIPATVRSRCQQFRLSAPDAEAASAWLRGELPEAAGDSALALAAAMAPRQPLRALALAGGEDLQPLADCAAALDAFAQRGDMGALLAAVAAVPPLELLSLLEARLQDDARQSAARGERRRLQAILGAEDEVRRLKRVQLSASNPNPDLLRHAAVQAFSRCCEAAADGATLGAT